jgi:hypothetical protein
MGGWLHVAALSVLRVVCTVRACCWTHALMCSRWGPGPACAAAGVGYSGWHAPLAPTHTGVGPPCGPPWPPRGARTLRHGGSPMHRGHEPWQERRHPGSSPGAMRCRPRGSQVPQLLLRSRPGPVNEMCSSACESPAVGVPAVGVRGTPCGPLGGRSDLVGPRRCQPCGPRRPPILSRAAMRSMRSMRKGWGVNFKNAELTRAVVPRAPSEGGGTSLVRPAWLGRSLCGCVLSHATQRHVAAPGRSPHCRTPGRRARPRHILRAGRPPLRLRGRQLLLPGHA